MDTVSESRHAALCPTIFCNQLRRCNVEGHFICISVVGNCADQIQTILNRATMMLVDAQDPGGKRSIPVLAALGEDGTELFRWGPRPAEAQAVFDAAAAEGLDKPAKLEKLHLFYGRDRGRALDAEWVELLTEHLAGAP